MFVGNWDERVQWSFRRIVYQVFAMHVLYGELKEDFVGQISKWIQDTAEDSVKTVCEQLTSDVFTQVLTTFTMADNNKKKVHYSIDVGHPMKFENVPKNLQYNDYLDMRSFFEIPCVKEVSRYVEEINLCSG